VSRDLVQRPGIDARELAGALKRDQAHRVAFADGPGQVDALQVGHALATAVRMRLDAAGQGAQQGRAVGGEGCALRGRALPAAGQGLRHPLGGVREFKQGGFGHVGRSSSPDKRN